jgi:hypothetical protein
VELGNAHPQDVTTNPDGTQTRTDLPGPTVTYVAIPDGYAGRLFGLERDPAHTDEEFEAADAAHELANRGDPLYTHPDSNDDSLLNDEIAAGLAAVPEGPGRSFARRNALLAHLGARQDGVTHLPNHSAFVSIAHPTQGSWANVAAPGSKPTWVRSNNAALEEFLADFYDCPAGAPAGLEDTHYTQYGRTVFPPGAAPAPDAVALHLNIGRDQQATNMFGWGYLGTTGTAASTSSTQVVSASEAGVSHSSNDSVGQTLYAGPNSSGTGATVYGVITANTSGATPTYTVDRWYTPSSPGGSAGTTPNGTCTYQVVSGGSPIIFVALSASTVAPSGSSTTMTGEITTGGGGLIAKIAPVTHSAAAATVVLTPVFTANGSDSLPVTIALAGASASIISTYAKAYQTQVSPTATISSSGDQLTLTWTFTMT